MRRMTSFGQEAFISIAWQLYALGLLVLAVWVMTPDWGRVLAVFAGGVTAIAPQWQAARWAFKYWGARSARKIVNAFYIGQIIKFLLTIALFALWFKGQIASPDYLLGSYLALVVIQRIAPLIIACKSYVYVKEQVG